MRAICALSNSMSLCWQVKENVNGKKVSIVEVKRAIHKIIPHD
jgi:hypothetical protein